MPSSVAGVASVATVIVGAPLGWKSAVTAPIVVPFGALIGRHRLHAHAVDRDERRGRDGARDGGCDLGGHCLQGRDGACIGSGRGHALVGLLPAGAEGQEQGCRTGGDEGSSLHPLSLANGRYMPGDQALDTLVDAGEGVLAQHRALGLVVELEVDPVDGEVPMALLGAAHEVAAQLRPGRLWRHRLRLEHARGRW